MRNYFRYVRGKSGVGIGAINIMEVNGTFRVGVSICAPSDTFSKTEARELACNRTLDNSEALVFSFYELVDNDWVVDLVDALPHREEVVGEFCSTMFDMIDDIVMDYAKEYYKSVKD